MILQKLTVPSVTAGEHDNNPPHFQLTQQEKPGIFLHGVKVEKGSTDSTRIYGIGMNSLKTLLSITVW